MEMHAAMCISLLQLSTSLPKRCVHRRSWFFENARLFYEDEHDNSREGAARSACSRGEEMGKVKVFFWNSSLFLFFCAGAPAHGRLTKMTRRV